MRHGMRHGRIWLIGMALLVLAPDASAHELLLETTTGDAVVVRLHYANGEPYAYETYELYRGDETLPHQIGRTSADGLIPFVPGAATHWRLRTASAGGHGIDTTLTVEAGRVSRRDRPLIERLPQVVVGFSLLFGLFGLLQLFRHRTKKGGARR